MSLWGKSDNVTSAGTVTLDYSTKIVTGSGSAFGAAGSAQVGDVLRFGIRGSGGVYFGDAVIKSIASATQLTIGSTEGLTGAAIAGTDFYVSELPSYSVDDYSYSEQNSGYDKLIYGISDATSQARDSDSSTDAYTTSGTGWVGVTTYNDMHGNLRVKSEILVAASGITTGANGISYPTAEA